MFYCHICRKEIPYTYKASHLRRDARKDRQQDHRHRLNIEEIRAMTSEVSDTPTTFQDAPPPSLGRRLISKVRSFLGF